MRRTILLVEDNRDERELLSELLTTQGYEVVAVSGFTEACERLQEQVFDTILTDLQLEGRDGLEVIGAVSNFQPGVPVIVVTGHGNLNVAIDALRKGAYDFITKPVDAPLLEVALRRSLEHRTIQTQLRQLREQRPSHERGRLLGECGPMKRVYDLIGRVSDTPSSVVVTGESGTGKELVARALHEGSSRREHPFVAINCSAVPASLLEAELFGHEKGAFTDAKRSREGLFVQAHRGTIFLDEIGDMPGEMQPKLLRVLQEQVVRPVGGDREREVDVRVVAATHRDLEDQIEKGQFREDLFYRLNVIQIHLPPLRSRGNDILLLASAFLKESAERLGRNVSELSPEAAELLLNFDWPGNVRQLQNCIERGVTLARFAQLTPQDLPEKVRNFEPPAVTAGFSVDLEHIVPLEVIERRYIEQVLRAVDNNKSQAARLLGLDRRTLYRKLDGYQEDVSGS
jgi:two-component system response regulator AtoC